MSHNLRMFEIVSLLFYYVALHKDAKHVIDLDLSTFYCQLIDVL